jgi:serine protease AprX
MSDNIPEPTDKEGRISVLIEMRTMPGASPASSMSAASSIELDGFKIDQEFEPVSIGGEVGPDGFSTSQPSYIVRGTVKSEKQIKKLRKHPDIAEIWKDTPISPFGWDDDDEDDDDDDATEKNEPNVRPDDNLGSGTCPIGTCDCQPWVAKGTMADVATYLGVDQIWARGHRGAGIVVGVLDSGITAVGRPVKAGETSRRIPRVIGGWPSDWGTESSKWGDHGNMCATDVLGMAPEAQLYDLRIAGSGGSPGTISRALQAFQWAINRHRTDGTPHILTNSWGIFQEAWDTTYARNPNHPFTRKVVEAINEGIIVLFAAGNCGSTCPDGRCGSDNGPGKSIWGANSHPRVMTVGAVNKNEQFVGYSSQGPGALDPNKPDFCSITHFQGYNASDSGTSAATPILAGVCALIKQANPAITHDQLKDCLKATAKDIGPVGFDQHSGAGIVQAKAAYDRCGRPRITTTPTIDTIASRDIIRTNPRIDTITIASRDLITTPSRDTNTIRDRITSPSRDVVKPIGSDTSPVRDRLETNPRIDFVKTPHLDTRDERLRQPIDPIRDRISQPIRGGQRPFVTAMPHHAEDWEYFDENEQGYDPYQDQNTLDVNALGQQIEQLSHQLAEMMELYESMTGQDSEGDCGCGRQQGGSEYDY